MFEAEIPNSSKVVTFEGIGQKFQSQSDLKDQGQDHHSSIWKIKSQMLQFLNVKTKILKVQRSF